MSNHYAIEGRQTATGVLVTVTSEPLVTRDDDAPRPSPDGARPPSTRSPSSSGTGCPDTDRWAHPGMHGARPAAAQLAAVRAVEGLRRSYGLQVGPVNMRVGHVANLATRIEAELFAGEPGDLADPAFAPMLALLDQTSPSAGALREAERLTAWRFGTF